MKGFILTSDFQDQGASSSNSSLSIKLRGVGEQGPFTLEFAQERPLFFIENRTPPLPFSYSQRRALPLKNFHGSAVDSLSFNTQGELEKARTYFQQKGVMCFEADIKPQDRFLMERFIRGGVEITGERIWRDQQWIYLKPLIKPAVYSPSFNSLSLDIETGMGGELYSVALHESKTNGQWVLMVRYGAQSENSATEAECSSAFHFTRYQSERELLLAFLERFHQIDPDLLIGWNVAGFDLHFLKRKFDHYKIPFHLGRGRSRASLIENKENAFIKVKIPGRVVIDGPTSLRSLFFTFENFKLETVAQKILGRGKEIKESGEKVQEIERRFRHDQLALASYNILDAVLVTDIFRETKLIDLLVTRTQISGIPMDRMGASIAAFDYFFLPRLHRKGWVAFNASDREKTKESPGGHILEPVTGLHHQVMVLDFKSLYPTLIRTFKIDPFSRLQSDKNPLTTPSGHSFSGQEHILPDFIGELMEMRSQAIKQGDKILSQNIKILMNSFYGVMGALGSRFYHPDLPSAITGSGKWVLKTSQEYLRGAGYEVLYGDTDSLFIKGGSDSDEKTGWALAGKLNQYLAEKIREQFQVTSYLEIRFEKSYSHFFLPSLRNGYGEKTERGAKKRYVGLSFKQELQFVGMEFVRSDWTTFAKKFQYELYRKWFAGENLEEWMKLIVQKLWRGEFDQELVYRKRLTRPLEEYQKTSPPHVKAARVLPPQKFGRRGQKISYYQTRRGPIPLEMNPQDLDYHHYQTKQMKPIADTLLMQGDFAKSFDEIVASTEQMSLPF